MKDSMTTIVNFVEKHLVSLPATIFSLIIFNTILKSFTNNKLFEITADQYRLKTHLQTTHEGKTFDCTQCDEKFKHNYILQEHIQTVHEGIKFQCEQCGKEYDKKQSLQTHIRHVHEGQRDYACQGKFFVFFKLAKHTYVVCNVSITYLLYKLLT